MNILFITASRIGDAVLSTGLLDHIARTWPQARVTIACGPLTASLFEAYPNLETIILLRKQKHHRHWLDLWLKTAGRHWDMVVDLRNSAVSRLLWTRERHVFGPHIDKTRHKAEQNAAVMGLTYTPTPRLWFTPEQTRKATTLIPAGNTVLAIGPSANWIAKTWPAERFIEIVEWLTAREGLMPNARVAVFAAPGEEETAYKVLLSVPEDRRIDVIAKTDPGTAAAALSRCDFYIGNDSGLMHCAAAAGIPTLGLFGPSFPALYRPWGPHASYVSTPESFEELINYPNYSSQTAPCLMESLSVEAVKNKILRIKNAGLV
ncbi:MAG: glycosyltransferase family 9 protein [Alphaproteobacteria bacterium]|nr:glycosyltransferase family 9 protein [Alphaproteobacteria bacterium]